MAKINLNEDNPKPSILLLVDSKEGDVAAFAINGSIIDVVYSKTNSSAMKSDLMCFKHKIANNHTEHSTKVVTMSKVKRSKRRKK